MQVILEGTNHSTDEKEVSVIVEYDDEDTWTFTFGKVKFSISELTATMKFLREQSS